MSRQIKCEWYMEIKDLKLDDVHTFECPCDRHARRGEMTVWVIPAYGLPKFINDITEKTHEN